MLKTTGVGDENRMADVAAGDGRQQQRSNATTQTRDHFPPDTKTRQPRADTTDRSTTEGKQRWLAVRKNLRPRLGDDD